MLRLFPAGARVAALFTMMISGISFAARPVRTLPVRSYTVLNKSAQQKRYKTPADMVMIPYLKAHAKAAPNWATSSKSDMARPNFGGYVNAPMFAARNTASLASGIFDTAVTVELVADFNKDGKPDLAVLQELGTLNVLLGDGAGNLATPVSYLNPNQQTTNVLVAYAADVNGDGSPDVIAYDYLNNAMITWLNLGNGTFNAAITTPLDTTFGYANTVYVADINGDGKADVVYTMTTNESPTSSTIMVESLLGVGDGTFGKPSDAKTQQFTVAADAQQSQVESMAIADLNGDGKLDLALGVNENFGKTGLYIVTTALGNGDGSFAALGKAQLTSATIQGIQLVRGYLVPFATSGIYLQDVNGDSKLDIVSDMNGTIYTAPGTGDGNFGVAVSSDEPISDGSTAVILDVNGDGKQDFVVAGDTLGVMLGKGDGTFTTPAYGSQFIIDPAGSYSLAAGDFNGDGKQDIAQLGGDYKQVSLFFNNGTTLRGAPVVTGSKDPVSTNWVLATSGKYTASGYVSPLVFYTNAIKNLSAVDTMVNDGEGHFKVVQALAGGVPSDLVYFEPFHADFNGDGLEDIAYTNATGDVLVSLSKGDGTFTTPKSIGLGAEPCPEYYADVNDINGDGKVDIVIPYAGDSACGSTAGGASGYWVALGKGDGTFAKPAFTAFGTELYSAVLADMNGDGVPDMILNDVPFINGSGYEVSLLPGNGNGTFGNAITVESSYIVSDVAAADINNDGKMDLVLSAEEVVGSDITTGGILTFLGNGDGTFNAPSMITSNNFFLGLQIADMNNDGNQDIVATLYQHQGQPVEYYGMVTLLGYGNGLFAAPVNQLESLASDTPQAGSFYADGAMDVMTATAYGPALFIGQGGSTLALTPSATAINFGNSETLTAKVTAALSGRPAATGTVSFYEGTTLLGTSTLSDGSAAYVPAPLAVGSHTIKAVYSGDDNFNPAPPATTTITVATVPPAFTLTGSPASVTVTGGAQGIVTLGVTANSTFSGTVTLTCSGMPTNGTCAINPGSVTLAADGSATATLVIGTTADHAQLQQPASPWQVPAAGLSLVVMFGIFIGRRKRIRMLSALGLVVLLSAGAMLVGCGDSGNSKKKSALTVTPGTYTVTVTAAPASGSSVATQTAKISVIVN
ncbi:FG-GAP-like repeat-containing protein [Occallatibacter riparius]|uniref:FG-GAP-like repeat-containing protein n=1 Tax=Occallatibacter riparius TaxID=1002689 RepID=A0A9J7BPG0_9BACT|nr:FG-GAP-like repeat-containing protein [Occallatibacter riparius]UWZ82814.1 FG-GAP-like repeat-containing protein [Occallatibacter riparius]